MDIMPDFGNYLSNWEVMRNKYVSNSIGFGVLVQFCLAGYTNVQYAPNID